jgi:hypothetical protein
MEGLAGCRAFLADQGVGGPAGRYTMSAVTAPHVVRTPFSAQATVLR